MHWDENSLANDWRTAARHADYHEDNTWASANAGRIESRFSGRVALVTGAASGIGAAVAKRLLAEGARIASLDLHPEASEGVLAVTADVSDSSQVDAAVAG